MTCIERINVVWMLVIAVALSAGVSTAAARPIYAWDGGGDGTNWEDGDNWAPAEGNTEAVDNTVPFSADGGPGNAIVEIAVQDAVVNLGSSQPTTLPDNPFFGVFIGEVLEDPITFEQTPVSSTLNVNAGGAITTADSRSELRAGSTLNINDGASLDLGRFGWLDGTVTVSGSGQLEFLKTQGSTSGALVLNGSAGSFLNSGTSNNNSLTLGNEATPFEITWVADAGGIIPLVSDGFYRKIGEVNATVDVSAMSLSDGDELILVDAVDGLNLDEENFLAPLSEEFDTVQVLGTSLSFATVYDEDNDDIKLVFSGSSAVPGDYNGDGLVDPSDYAFWSNQYAAELGGGAGDLAADGNGDGVIDPSDYAFWSNEYAAILAGGGSAVPEPTTLALLGVGGLLAARRRVV